MTERYIVLNAYVPLRFPGTSPGNRWKRSRSTQLSAASFLISLSHVFGLNALTDVAAHGQIGWREKRVTTHLAVMYISALPHSYGERVTDSSQIKAESYHYSSHSYQFHAKYAIEFFF